MEQITVDISNAAYDELFINNSAGALQMKPVAAFSATFMLGKLLIKFYTWS